MQIIYITQGMIKEVKQETIKVLDINGDVKIVTKNLEKNKNNSQKSTETNNSLENDKKSINHQKDKFNANFNDQSQEYYYDYDNYDKHHYQKKKIKNNQNNEKIKKLENTICESNSENIKLQNIIKQLKLDNKNLQENIEDNQIKKNALIELEEKYTLLSKQNQNLKKENLQLKNSEKKDIQKDNKICNLEQKIHHLNEKIQIKDNEIYALKTKNQQLLELNKQFITKIQENQKKIKTLETEKKDFEQDSTIFQSHISALELKCKNAFILNTELEQLYTISLRNDIQSEKFKTAIDYLNQLLESCKVLLFVASELNYPEKAEELIVAAQIFKFAIEHSTSSIQATIEIQERQMELMIGVSCNLTKILGNDLKEISVYQESIATKYAEDQKKALELNEKEMKLLRNNVVENAIKEVLNNEEISKIIKNNNLQIEIAPSEQMNEELVLQQKIKNLPHYNLRHIEEELKMSVKNQMNKIEEDNKNENIIERKKNLAEHLLSRINNLYMQKFQNENLDGQQENIHDFNQIITPEDNSINISLDDQEIIHLNTIKLNEEQIEKFSKDKNDLLDTSNENTQTNETNQTDKLNEDKNDLLNVSNENNQTDNLNQAQIEKLDQDKNDLLNVSNKNNQADNLNQEQIVGLNHLQIVDLDKLQINNDLNNNNQNLN